MLHPAHFLRRVAVSSRRRVNSPSPIRRFALSPILVPLLLAAAGLALTGQSAEQVLYIDQLDLTKAVQSHGKPAAGKTPKDTAISLNGKKFDQAFGTQANGSLVIDLKAAAKSFSATVGVDDSAVGDDALVRFYVVGDGKLLTESGIMHRGADPKTLTADLTGIKQLVLRCDDAQTGNATAYADWANARLVLDPAAKDRPVTVAADQALPELQVFVDQLDLKKATQGWNTTNVNTSAEYNPVTLKGKTFLHAVGTHADGLIVIDLKGAAKSFTAIAGIDDDAAEEGSCGFTVIGDGKVLAKTGTINRPDPVKEIKVDLTGVKQLVLQVDSGDDDNINNDHADWAMPLITLDPAKAKDRPVTVPASQAKLPN